MDKSLTNKLVLPTPHARPPKHRDHRANPREARDYSPLPWHHCFSQQLDVRTSETDLFHVYTLGTEGPVVLLLHGGGHSALSWSLFADSLVKSVKCRVLAIDSRGHGGTSTGDDWDLSWQRQAQDAADVFNKMYVSEDDGSVPPVILVGHSMGGAVAVRLCSERLLPSQAGLVVIDVVEGTAVDALGNVQGFLQGRPDRFKSLEEAIEWNVKTGQIRNLQSARVSVPSVVRRIRQGEILATKKRKPEPAGHITTVSEPSTDSVQLDSQHAGATPVNESTATNTVQDSQQTHVQTSDGVVKGYTWRIDLARTEPHWRGWFVGLSSLFLSCPVPKILIIAGMDRLDRELTIGQMQGKFQFHVLSKCSHVVHEDAPDEVAELIADFMLRFKLTA